MSCPALTDTHAWPEPLQAAHHASTAAQLGGDALVEQCNQLQADLMNCQQVRVVAWHLPS